MMLFGVPFGTLLALAAIAVLFLGTPVGASFISPVTKCRAVICDHVTTENGPFVKADGTVVKEDGPVVAMTIDMWKAVDPFGQNEDEGCQMSLNPAYTTKDNPVWQGQFPRVKKFVCDYSILSGGCGDRTDTQRKFTYQGTKYTMDIVAKGCKLRDSHAIVAC